MPRASLALLLLALAACRRPDEPRGRWMRCTCDYLTDMDQPGKVKVDACVLRTVPEALATTCATHRGVGRVGDCRCEAPGEPCKTRDGLCRDVD